MKNVVLFESHYRSRSWFLALKDICNLHIISSLREEHNFFIGNGISQSKILNLRKFNSDNIDLNTAIDYLSKVEKDYNFNFVSCVLMDRKLRTFKDDYVIKYLYYIHLNIYNFLKENKIESVIIEPTWTHELVSYYICRDLSIKYFAPVRDKIVGDSFYIFTSYLRDEPFERKKNVFRDFSTLYNNSNITPYFNYFSNRNKVTIKKYLVLFDLIRLNFFGYLNKNIHSSFIRQFSQKITHIIRYYLLTLILKFQEIEKIKSPFILFTLHVQPEAGIDVIGSKYSNQLECIRQIASGMPIGYKLAVKEHPHDFGRRNYAFYKELRKIPNTILISHKESTKKIFNNNNLVLCVSVAGTSSLEASLRGIPAVTLVKMYFHELMIAESFDPFTNNISNLLKQIILKNNAFEKYNQIFSNSFQGNCGDFKTDPYAISIKNISLLKDAFSEVIEH